MQRAVDPAAGALLAALAVGVTGEVSARQWRVFNATGITHLIAISGMHVTFFALISMWLARRVWGWIPPLQRSVRRESFAAVTGVLLAAGYALLSGFSVPAQRTLVMLAAFLALREASRESRPCASVGVATVAILRVGSTRRAGRRLLAVVRRGGRNRAASRTADPRRRRADRGRRCAAMCLGCAAAADTRIFGTFSGIGLIVNAFAIPLFTFALVPCVLLATLGYLLPGALAGQRSRTVWSILPPGSQVRCGRCWGRLQTCPAQCGPQRPEPGVFLVATGAAVLVLLPLSAVVRLVGTGGARAGVPAAGGGSAARRRMGGGAGCRRRDSRGGAHAAPCAARRYRRDLWQPRPAFRVPGAAAAADPRGCAARSGAGGSAQPRPAGCRERGAGIAAVAASGWGPCGRASCRRKWTDASARPGAGTRWICSSHLPQRERAVCSG